jgi:hypothetical protein
MTMRRRTNRAPGATGEKQTDTSGSTREANLSKVLTEIYELLESYGPTWYTEAMQKKIEAALEKS